MGLGAKNAILIVEFALLQKQHGWPAAAAATEAARKSVGTGVMGGMLAATFLAVFFVPFFFKLIMDRRLRTKPEEFIAPEDDDPM